jgi:hypothetical protein
MALGPTQPPIQWVSGALSLGVKRPGSEADHSRPSSAEVKEWMELYLHSPNTPSWRGAQLKHRDNFTFTFKGFLARHMKVTLRISSFYHYHELFRIRCICLFLNLLGTTDLSISSGRQDNSVPMVYIPGVLSHCLHFIRLLLLILLLLLIFTDTV